MTRLLRYMFLTVCVCLLMSVAMWADYAEGYQKLKDMPTGHLLELGEDYNKRRNMPDSALMVYSVLTSRLGRLSSDDDKRLMIEAYNGLWYTHFFFYCDYATANKSLRRSLELCDDIDAPKGLVYFNLGCMYQGMAEISNNISLFKEAAGYYKKACAAIEEEGDDALLAASVGNYVIVAHYLGDIGMVKDVMADFSARVDEMDLGDLQWRLPYVIHLYEGLKALQQRNYAEAERCFSLQLEEAGDDHIRYLITALINRSLALEGLGRHEDALGCLEKCMEICNRYDLKDFRLQVLDFMSSHYHNDGDEKHAMEMRNRYLGLKDSLLNYQQMASVKEMSIYDQMRKTDMEIAAMKRREERQMQILVIGGVVVIAAISLFVVIFVKNRKLHSLNRTLYNKNEELLRAEEERRVLIREQGQSRGDSQGSAIPPGIMSLPGEEPVDEVNDVGSEIDDAESPDTGKYRKSLLDDAVKKDIMRKILDVMEDSDEIYQQGFKADTLSRLTGINYKYISQVINETCGCNFNVFLNEYRVKRACRLINSTEEGAMYTIEGLANKVGFKSRNAFAAAFKKFTGLNPSEYLKIASQGKSGRAPGL